MTDDAIQHFIDRWAKSGGAERANYGLFLTELCGVLEVEHPQPTVPESSENAYVFEKAVVFDNPDGTHTTKFIDFYRRGCFVLETKQGVEREDSELVLSAAGKEKRNRRKKGHGTRGSAAWDDAMLRAQGQAEQYARALPASEGRPPFVVVVDVGHTIELYSEFTQTGGNYVPFPDPRSNRIKLAQLADAEVRNQLGRLWTDPLTLDPARRSAKVTREIAAKLAELAKSLEVSGHEAEDVAQFLMRCLFTMFAEDVGLLDSKKTDVFLEVLKGLESHEHFVPVVEQLWQTMNIGGFSVLLRKKLLRFNGGLFAHPSALPVTRDQLDLLIEAATADWRDVEPAIFGTLLERALNPIDRHKLGAHYTPRAYVERLVIPTIVEPLREEWDAVRVAAVTLAKEGDRKAAVAELEKFHDRLCEIKVLDPACGSGNFLYVTLEHLKRLEGEVFATYESIGERQIKIDSEHTVDPHQLLGIEINPRAAAIAELVLWIGYLQWHYRTRGDIDPPEPVIRNFKNIECRDAVLTWSSKQPLLDDNNQPITHWDGRTTKKDPGTGEEVPDESARELSYKYLNPKKAEWPTADFIIGNPPFVGEKKMRHDLGDSYVDTLHATFDELPSNIDYVMYWWSMASKFVLDGSVDRLGLITTKAITQQTNRPIVQQFLDATDEASLSFVIPNHPWVDATLCAAVRIAMSVARLGKSVGLRREVTSESNTGDFVETEFKDQSGKINADFRIGVDIREVTPLKSNADMCLQGIKLVAPRKGPGLQVSQEERERFLSISNEYARYLPLYIAGKDITETLRYRYVIDFYDLTEDEAREAFVEGYQQTLSYLKKFRANNSMKSRREKWWQLGVNAPKLRSAMLGIDRIILTSEVAEHRTFSFFKTDCMLPDGAVAAIPHDDAHTLGILSSRFSTRWAYHAGGRMGKGDTPRYQNGPCFDPFPFPVSSHAITQRIRSLGEQLDAHRKRQQELHPTLTMTGMYNVLEKLRSGAALSAKDQQIHEQGLVSVLRQIHDDLDAAVAEAYGWPVDLSDEQILERLVALNAERAEEERRGLIRWLRPEFQNPAGRTQQQVAADAEAKTPTTKKTKRKKQPWPKSLSAQAAAVHAALLASGKPTDEIDLAKHFTRANQDRIAELLSALAALGRARELDDGRFVAV